MLDDFFASVSSSTYRPQYDEAGTGIVPTSQDSLIQGSGGTAYFGLSPSTFYAPNPRNPVMSAIPYGPTPAPQPSTGIGSVVQSLLAGGGAFLGGYAAAAGAQRPIWNQPFYSTNPGPALTQWPTYFGNAAPGGYAMGPQAGVVYTIPQQQQGGLGGIFQSLGLGGGSAGGGGLLGGMGGILIIGLVLFLALK